MNLKSAQTAKVGKIFKDARLQKSLSLTEVSIEAVINIEYIRAIESGDYTVFHLKFSLRVIHQRIINC